jgi:phosphoglycolate phosphatase
MTCSVLLDLDGTLIDSQPGILASCLAALRALGHEPDETLDIRGAIGPPLEDLMQILLQSYGDDRIGEAVAAYRQHYGESGFLGSAPYPGIGKSLEEMKRTGLRLYLATSKRAVFASRILDHLKFATTSMASMAQRRAASWITSLNCSPIFCPDMVFRRLAV